MVAPAKPLEQAVRETSPELRASVNEGYVAVKDGPDCGSIELGKIRGADYDVLAGLRAVGLW